METRKRIKKSIVALVCVLLLASMVFSLVACDEKGDPNVPTINIVTTPYEDGATVSKGDKITFVVAVSDGSPYTVFVDNTDVASVKGNVLTINKDVTVDTDIKLIVKINRLPNVTKSVTFKMKAPVSLPTLSMTANKPEKSRLAKDDTITINASASDGSDVILSVSNENIAKIEGNVVTVIAEPEHEESLVVTATLANFPSVMKSKQYYVKAPEIAGQVTGKDGNVLTTDAIKALGNKSITVNGNVKDYFVDASDGSTTYNEYISKIMMEEGKWYGEWYAVNNSEEEESSTPNIITDSFVSTEEANYVGEYGDIGHGIQRVFIDKNNKVSRKLETGSLSVPYLWENLHYWNHVEEFATNISKKFVYRPEEDVFEYVWKTIDSDGAEVVEDEYDYYLMTYISYSFTPMMDETLENFYFKMENGEITKIIAKTAEQTGSNKNRAYTIVEFTFENIGTTTVPEPTPYEKDSRNNALATALEKMRNATSYTFETAEVATSNPVGDPSDYEVSASTSASFPAGANTGTVGLTGRITEDAILLTRTGKYDYTMDGDMQYHMEYTGYKNNDNGTYDYFEYDFSEKALKGKRNYEGTIASAGVLPGWDLSEDVFVFDGSSTDRNGKTVTKYVLRNSQIIEGAAKEVCMHSNVKNTVASSNVEFSITVDSDGNVVSTTFPYAYGSYAGYCRTTYSKVNSTQFTDEFNNYIQRVLPEWEDLQTVKYYHKHTSDLSQYECYNAKGGENACHYYPDKCTHIEYLNVVIEKVFGDAASVFPKLSDFRKIFDDNVNMAGDTNDILGFYDFNHEELADGTDKYTDFVTWTASAPDEYLDANGALYGDGFNAFYARLNNVMVNLGYTYNSGVSDVTGGESGTIDKKLVYSVEGKLVIVYTVGRNNRVDVDVYNWKDYSVTK